MNDELKTHVRSADTWTRGLFILLFAIIYSIAEVVLGAIVLFQFGSQLITGKINDKLYRFSIGLTAYFYQLVQFFTYRSDLKPYPFSEWPSEGLETVKKQEEALQQTLLEKQEQASTSEAGPGEDTTEPKG